MSDLENELMEFRSNYLIAVGKAWQDKEFKAELCEPDNALNAINKITGYNCPWDLDVHVDGDSDAKGPFYNPNRGVYMTVPYVYERFTCYFPNAEKVSAEDRLDALSKFYRLNNTFLRPNIESVKKDSLLAAPSGTPKLVRECNFTSGEDCVPVSDYDLGDDAQAFQMVGAAMMSALALAWSDTTFNEKLITTEANQEQRSLNPAYTVNLLKRWLDDGNNSFDYPWSMGLTIKNDPDAEYGSSPTLPGEKDWTKLTKSHLYLTLPQKPENESSNLIAITKYNVDGSGFPFTCG